MQLFSKKKEEPKISNAPIPYSKDLQEIQKAVEPSSIFPTLVEEEHGQTESPTAVLPQVKPSSHVKTEDQFEEIPTQQNFAPVFVKMDKYRDILNALVQLKSGMTTIHGSFNALEHLERARTDSLKILEEALDKVENKIIELDSELVKPPGYTGTVRSEQYAEASTIETTITDLREQIERLKAELD